MVALRLVRSQKGGSCSHLKNKWKRNGEIVMKGTRIIKQKSKAAKAEVGNRGENQPTLASGR